MESPFCEAVTEAWRYIPARCHRNRALRTCPKQYASSPSRLSRDTPTPGKSINNSCFTDEVQHWFPRGGCDLRGWIVPKRLFDTRSLIATGPALPFSLAHHSSQTYNSKKCKVPKTVTNHENRSLDASQMFPKREFSKVQRINKDFNDTNSNSKVSEKLGSVNQNGNFAGSEEKLLKKSKNVTFRKRH
ncbi:hypothetical protein G9A89_002392 [Geosiphon pyriformis]|nr:hypothetical protein G9A89_002392 [Geosiphon pyriformis]